MNQRVENIIKFVTDGNRVQYTDEQAIGEKLLQTAESEKLAMIEAEYTKAISMDADSLLAGTKPTVKFWERRPMAHADFSQRLADVFNKYTDEQLSGQLLFAGNHCSANFESVVKHGMQRWLQQIEDTQKTVTDPHQREYLEDLYFACKAIITWTKAHGKAARLAAEQAATPERRAELLEIAEICENVPEKPAKTFREAIQSYFFAYNLFPDGLGRIDQYLYPCYQADLDAGRITPEQALHLIEEMFVKMFSYGAKTYYNWSGSNHGVVAGYTPEGECGHNAVTAIVLQAIMEVPTWRPQISYRVTAKTTDEQFRQAVEANLKKPDLIMFLNDDVVVANLVREGVAYEDAVNYSVSGCNETILTGCSQVGALEGHYNALYSMERLLQDTEALANIDSFDRFYRVWEQRFEKDFQVVRELSYDRDAATARNPEILQSLFTEGCITSATPVTEGGAKYNFCTWCLTALVNLADCLSIIRQTVFEEKRYTLAQLGEFLRADWNGYEKERAYIKNHCRFFGNDDDSVDALVNQITASVNRMAEDWVPYRGGKFLFGTLTGYEIAHVEMGKLSGASLDGRYATDPFAASVDCSPGTGKNGVTAYLKSAAKLKGEYLASSVVVNLKLSRTMVNTEDKKNLLAHLFRAYFQLGGVHLQVNYLSAEELRKAQENPDQYCNLRVRVTGFSGFFTAFDKKLQDEIINRTQYSC